MPESSHNQHYNHIMKLQTQLDDHPWSRRQTDYDSKFIAYLTAELQLLANEAYSLGHENKVSQ
jgi:hypothetical protein